MVFANLPLVKSGEVDITPLELRQMVCQQLQEMKDELTGFQDDFLGAVDYDDYTSGLDVLGRTTLGRGARGC